MPIAAFEAYYGDLVPNWERLALTRARVLRCRRRFGKRVAESLTRVLAKRIDRDLLCGDVRAMRHKLESSRGPTDLKRSAGGLADIEFLIQYLQICHADRLTACPPNLWATLDAIEHHSLLPPAAVTELRDAYDFLRTVENRLRIQQNRAVLDWPTGFAEVARLVRGMASDPIEPMDAVVAFRDQMAHTLAITRHWFNEIVA